MARGVKPSVNRGQAKGVVLNGGPPPSTLAAQIVDNHARNNLSQEPHSRRLFGQLLEEYLRDSVAEEANLQLSSRLISVVAEAGFDGLLKSDPFAQNLLLPQAVNSISVIELTIRRQPDLVLYVEHDEADIVPRPRLLLRLLPKLIALLGRKGMELVQKPIADLLRTILHAFDHSLDRREEARSIPALFEACLEDILRDLHRLNTPGRQPLKTLRVPLPPARSIKDLWPGGHQLIALPQGCQTDLTNVSQAITVGLVLNSVLSDDLESSDCVLPGPPAALEAFTSFDHITSLWKLYSALQKNRRISTADCERVEVVFVQISTATLARIGKTPNSFRADQAATLLLRSIANIVKRFLAKRTVDKIVFKIAQSLVQLYHALHTSYSHQGLANSRVSQICTLAKHCLTEAASVTTGPTTSDFRSKELELAVSLWTASPQPWIALAPPIRDWCNTLLRGEDIHVNQEVTEAFSTLRVHTEDADFADSDRPSKRRRIDREEESYDIHAVPSARNLKRLLQIQLNSTTDSDDPTAMLSTLRSRFDQLPEDAQCATVKLISFVPCTTNQTVTGHLGEGSGTLKLQCSLCDARERDYCSVYVPSTGAPPSANKKEALVYLEALTASPSLQRSKRPRILLAEAIRRAISHSCDGSEVDLNRSALGQWCLKSLHSSLRELRLAAGRTVATFLRDDIASEVLKKNRILVLEFLRELAERGDTAEQESVIFAIGQLARVCGRQELNIALLRLVEYLGHTNALVNGMAYNEILNLARALGKKPAELFRPFWHNVAPAAVKDLLTLPQKVQQLADLLQLSVSHFLLLTQTSALPFLVLSKRSDVLRRLALTRGAETPVEHLCMQPSKNLAAIVALLLRQPSTNIEDTVMDLLAEAAPAFKEYDLATLIKLEPILIACDLLKAAADADQAQRPLITQALNVCARLTGRRPNSKKAAGGSVVGIANFFETNALGMMAHLANIIEQPKDSQPLTEKQRCLKAIEEMLRLGRAHAVVALPQIRACLQFAIENPDLCDDAFSAWTILLTILPDDELDTVIEQTFAIVARNFSHFTSYTQQKAGDTIRGLIKNQNARVRDRIAYIPSLGGVSLLTKIESEIVRLKAQVDVTTRFEAFIARCSGDNTTIVAQALSELQEFLEVNQRTLHEAAAAQVPSTLVARLSRTLLDVSVNFSEVASNIPTLAAECLGLLGCSDSFRIETVRPQRDILVLSNFERADEVIDFTALLLERILVPAFHSASNAKAQGFLAYAMQELLKSCGFSEILSARANANSDSSSSRRRWLQIPEGIRNTLTPLLSSKYLITITAPVQPEGQQYPIYTSTTSHGAWLKAFVYDLLRKGSGDNAEMIFSVLARVVRGPDSTVANFMLPFAALNVLVGGTVKESDDVLQELMTVLGQTQTNEQDSALKQCSESVFQILDYLSRWLQEKRKHVTEMRSYSASRGSSQVDELSGVAQISSVERFLQAIPAEVISSRAVECGSYARALFHWEQYVRQEDEKTGPLSDEAQETLFERLQHIYTQIDDPDSIEGISAHMRVLSPDQQVLEHNKAGRWSAVQSSYQLFLTERPNDIDLQVGLLNGFREAGQYDSLLKHYESFQKASGATDKRLLSMACEASWSTTNWSSMESLVSIREDNKSMDFNVEMGRILLALQNDETSFAPAVQALRKNIAGKLTASSTNSLKSCHDLLLQLHALYEVELLSGNSRSHSTDVDDIIETLDRRLDIVGAYTADKQWLLGLRRAVMQSSKLHFSSQTQAVVWLTSARLARKSAHRDMAFDAVIHAARLGGESANIEHSRLLWKDGHHRKAIQNLQGATAAMETKTNATSMTEDDPLSALTTSTATSTRSARGDRARAEDPVAARAFLLLAKWLDSSGQTQSKTIIGQYQKACRANIKWEKGHYYLGRHYNKLLEFEKLLPANKQKLNFQEGEHHKLVIDCFIRSFLFGSKYYFQTMPRMLTLWLDLGTEAYSASKSRVPDPAVDSKRMGHLQHVHEQLEKYVPKIPAYTFYIAFSQIITRISHPHEDVYRQLSTIILKVLTKYPAQALWSILAVVKSSDKERSSRGAKVLTRLQGKKKSEAEVNLSHMISRGQALSNALLKACDSAAEGRTGLVSLSHDLKFRDNVTPCPLVVPIEANLIATLPSVQDGQHIKTHNPFPRKPCTIESISDEVLVLSSLQRPKKLVVRGSDGNKYGLLCKPKDDLRKDQRLMEFNAMINRALQRDPECSKRGLYIRTYAVTPLNEECGTIEWVEGLKPMRDIILKLYRQKNLPLDYKALQIEMDEFYKDNNSEPCKFATVTLKRFPPVLYEWFISTFPSPDTWFAARLRYARSCAVMSVVGHILGLGDRHGENVLLEEGNGGTFHVDFNCLFDKGLTFEKPELVPFRLTHNMVDAFGAYGVEGPFRTAAELTYQICRQNEDTLMTILETFVYDPTADFLGERRSRKRKVDVPETPIEVLESVKTKLKGLLRGESVPLSVEGYVDALIGMARDPRRLSGMYIGWCPFF